jgi:phage terminase large subunit GpA-like protein
VTQDATIQGGLTGAARGAASTEVGAGGWDSSWEAYVEAMRPPEPLTPSAFAQKYRVLHEVYCSERPGRWDNSVFPYQGPAMDVVKEAIETGKKGVVFMKAGQIGGTDCMINASLWLKVYYPGPQLFMTSTEKVASEFGRERFALIIDDMEPLRKKYLPNKRGDILTKRFVDGKIQLSGGQSVFNLQSTPYRIVTVDELDSLVENLGGQGDPLKLAEVRTDSFTGETLLIAYAHPSVKDRGAGRLYYEASDQRRAFVKHDCGGEFYLQWDHIKCLPEADMTQAQAQADPDCYHYVCPQCGALITDAERVSMCRQLVYKSMLPPEIAAKRAWIGIHASQLYSPAKTIRSLAQRWIESRGHEVVGLDGNSTDENLVRVFYNKVLGEPYEPKVKAVDVAALRQLVAIQRRANDPEHYLLGQVPPWVRFLTAGQDSRSTELHAAVWGWGLRRDVNSRLHLCGALIDHIHIPRQYALTFTAAEFHVFDDLVYRRKFPVRGADRFLSVAQCGHDTGYAPTQIAIAQFSRHWRFRAIPVKGASEKHSSYSSAPVCRWGVPIRYKGADGREVVDDAAKQLLINTYLIKVELFGWMAPPPQEVRVEVLDRAVDGSVIGTRKVPRLTFPEDVGDRFLEESKNEGLTAGDRRGEKIWKKTGPNHFADCNTYALAIAHNLDPFQRHMTGDDIAGEAKGGTRREGDGMHDDSIDNGRGSVGSGGGGGSGWEGGGGGGFDPSMG